MRTFISALFCAFVLLISAPVHAAEAQPTADQLIARLGSEDFDERNAATEKLAAMGEIARENLEKAAAGNDPDIRIAATELLARLGQTSLTFLVVDRDGKPLAGVQGELTLESPDGEGNDDNEPLKLTTREDGTASAGKVQPGTYLLTLKWTKYASVSGDTSPRNVRLLPGANRMVFTLTQGGTVQATALNADGKPLEGAQLSLETFTGTTDAEGKVKLEHVPDGTYRGMWKIESQHLDGPIISVTEGQVTKVPAAKLTPKGLGSVKLTLQKSDGTPLVKSNSYVTLARTGQNPALDWAEMIAQSQELVVSKFAPNQHTDEAGKLSLESLEAGKYRLLIRDFDNVPDDNGMIAPWLSDAADFRLYFVAELEVKAGAPTELTLKPIEGGAVKGTVVSDDGTPLNGVTVALVQERFASQVALENAADYEGIDLDSFFGHTTAGGFELKHVTPGKYMLIARPQSGRRTFVFNVVVEDGKTAELFPVKVATQKAAAAEIKGKVLLPNGKPCPDADVVVLAANNSQASDTTGEDGAFTVDLHMLNSPPRKVRINAAGYQFEAVDLSAAGVDPQNLLIHLKTQAFGGLHLTTVDEAGKPLAGVKVWPGDTGVSGKLHVKQSDAKGELVFTSLAAGAREFKAEKAGYLSVPSLRATVVEGRDDTTAPITLQRGLKVTGHIELPANVAAASAGVVLTELASATEMWTTLNAKNEFTFSGLEPGAYLLSAVAAGCVLDGAPPQLAVALSGTTPSELTLRLVPHGGAAINLGPAYAGRGLKLLPADVFQHFDQFWTWYAIDTQPEASATGRAEFLAPPREYVPFVLDDLSDENAPRNTVAARATEPLTIQPIKAVADLTTLPAKDAKIVAGTASATVTLTPAFPEGVSREDLALFVDVLLVGKQAVCSFSYRTPDPESARIVGTPPPDFQVERQRFTAEKLPAGEYKLVALLQDSHGEIIGQKLLGERTLKEGESADLGEVKIAIPKAARPATEDEESDPVDPDKDENFKP